MQPKKNFGEMAKVKKSKFVCENKDFQKSQQA